MALYWELIIRYNLSDTLRTTSQTHGTAQESQPPPGQGVDNQNTSPGQRTLTLGQQCTLSAEEDR